MNKDPVIFLEHILESIRKIESYIIGLDYPVFIKDSLRQDGVIRQLEVIGEACTHLEEDFRNTHQDFPWAEIIAMRNFLIHEYWEIDLEKVWDTVKHDLPPLKSRLEEISSKR
jgi:uncharacterized protein with HEPN domain